MDMKKFEGLVITLSERIAKLEVNSEYHKELIDELREKINKLEWELDKKIDKKVK